MAVEDLETELDSFRRVQRMAYDAAEAVARRIEPGATEKQAAEMLRRELSTRGVEEYFHKPFAWFGDRTTFPFRSPLKFFPSDRRLERGSPAILDVGPVLDGVAADIGYSFAKGHCPPLTEALGVLAELRRLILELVLADKSMAAIYGAVDRAIRDAGYENRHRRYPFQVLAHRVDRVRLTAFRKRTLMGFGPGGLELLGRTVRAALPYAPYSTALWNGGRLSDVQVSPGLWAVEPHIAKGGVGAKWEEMLVVTRTTACWLDDDLPHVPTAARARAPREGIVTA